MIVFLHDETDLHGEKDYIEPKHVDIELNHVSYSYPDSNEIVLKDVSLQIKAGKKNCYFREKWDREIYFTKIVNRGVKPSKWPSCIEW